MAVMTEGRPGWRWFLLHTMVIGVLLFWLISRNAAGEVNDDGGDGLSLFTALLYCPLAGFATALRGGGVLSAGAVSFVTFFVGSVAALLAHTLGAHDTRQVMDLFAVPGSRCWAR